MASDGKNIGSETPAIHETAPPEWLPKTSSSGDLGFQGFYPPRPGQDEDVLSEVNIKQGFTLKHSIPAETYTTKGLLIKTLKEDNFFPELEDFMNQVFRRRLENLPQIPATSFRIPSRVTLNDAKRNAWFADLAKPDVPLIKLGKSVPHGVRGNELLDLLQSNNVALPRAVWFVRVLGANETAGIRNKPNYNPMQYSVDWANVVNGYLKKQLGEIALPIAPRPGLNIKQTFKGVLTDPDSRERWVARFVYTLELLRIFYAECMVDHSTFLSWLAQQMASCNLAQAGFVARLVDGYLDGFTTRRALARPLVDACLLKLQDISTSSSKDSLIPLEERLRNVLLRIFLAIPSAFVSPRTWKMFSPTIREIVTSPSVHTTDNDASVSQNVRRIWVVIEETFVDVERRNEALLFLTLSHPIQGCLRATVADVQLLNSITATTDLTTIAYFDDRIESDRERLTHKIHLLLSWSVCPVQYGDHRPYATMTLLRIWRDRTEERAIRRDFESPDEIIQDDLFDWLDSDDLAGDVNNSTAISILFGELVERGLFSYDKYIQRLIARGEIGLSYNEENSSRHRHLLQTIPLHAPDPALTNQRRIALYGVRARQTPEDQSEAAIREELRYLLPEIFGGSRPDETKALIDSGMVIRTAGRYEQVRVVKHWLLPALRKYLSRAAGKDANSKDVERVFCVVVDILESMKCFRSLLDISLGLLKNLKSAALLEGILDTLRRHLDIWASMDVMGTVTDALLVAHHAWKAQGIFVRPLVSLLLEVDDYRFLDDASRLYVNEAATHYAQALCPADEQPEPVPSILPEILVLSQEADADVPANLANGIWFKYRTSNRWVYTVWDNVVTSIRQLPLDAMTLAERQRCALQYGTFLKHVDQHSVDGIDPHLRAWFLHTGLNEMASLSEEAWGTVIDVFLFLAISGALKVTTILEGVVYPVWKFASEVDSPEQFESVRLPLTTLNNLCKLLLLHDDVDSEADHPLHDLGELQKIRTRRKDVYRLPHFQHLVDSLPVLVFTENNICVDQEFRDAARDLRQSICALPAFKVGASRSLDIVLVAFTRPLSSERMLDSMHEPLMSALRLVFNESEHADGEAEAATILSPWKLSSSLAVTKFALQQIGKRLGGEATRVQAEAELSELVNCLMHADIKAEEADFISEMAKGVSSGVAAKFLDKGLERISEILNEAKDLSPETLRNATSRAGDILKLLSTITLPFRDPYQPEGLPELSLPAIEASVQDDFVHNFLEKLRLLEGRLSEEARTSTTFVHSHSLTEPVIFLARLLQFDLGFPGVWTPRMKEHGDEILNLVFRLACVRRCLLSGVSWILTLTEKLHGGEFLTSPTAFTLLIDTVFYAFDEFPNDSKHLTVDLFQHCPTVEPSALPSGMPPEFRKLAQTMLRYTSTNLPSSNLFYGHHDANGDIQLGSPVQMRPWEWIDNIGDLPALDAKERQKEEEEKERLHTKYIVRNSASLPLELFGTRLTGEGIRSSAWDELTEAERDHAKDEPAGLFEDDLVAESMFERDWRESRVLGAESSAAGGADREEEGREESAGAAGKGVRRGTPVRSSPALSVRTSGQSSGMGPTSATSSRRTQSPAIERVWEMSVEGPLGAGAKRKAVDAASESSGDGAAAERGDGSQGAAKRGRGKTVASKTVAAKRLKKK